MRSKHIQWSLWFLLALMFLLLLGISQQAKGQEVDPAEQALQAVQAPRDRIPESPRKFDIFIRETVVPFRGEDEQTRRVCGPYFVAGKRWTLMVLRLPKPLFFLDTTDQRIQVQIRHPRSEVVIDERAEVIRAEVWLKGRRSRSYLARWARLRMNSADYEKYERCLPPLADE